MFAQREVMKMNGKELIKAIDVLSLEKGIPKEELFELLENFVKRLKY